jgi:hypothetical protein
MRLLVNLAEVGFLDFWAMVGGDGNLVKSRWGGRGVGCFGGRGRAVRINQLGKRRVGDSTRIFGGRRDKRHDGMVMYHNIVLAYAQLKIKDVEKFALDAADIALAKDTSADCPVYVFERRIIQVLMIIGRSVYVDL